MDDITRNPILIIGNEINEFSSTQSQENED